MSSDIDSSQGEDETTRSDASNRNNDSDYPDFNPITDYSTFAPLITEVSHRVENIGNLCELAEHNRRICGALFDRVAAVEAPVKVLKVRRKERKSFFETPSNYSIFQNFVKSIEAIQLFVEDISQIKSLRKYTDRPGEISQKFRELIEEFDKCTKLLEFPRNKEYNEQSKEDGEALSLDLEELQEYIQNIKGGITDGNLISETPEVVAALSKGFKKNQIPPIFEDAILKEVDFRRTSFFYGSKVEKRIRIVDSTEVSFKEVGSLPKETKDNIINEVSILKKLDAAENIIVFYGIVYESPKIYLVTEWATHNDLRHYYKKNIMLWPQKVQFAVHIIRGLTYLNAASILHHDIRSPNVFITSGPEGYVAKIGNFGLSRGYNDVTNNVKEDIDSVRYMAPEKLKNREHKYDLKCEIYSFGVLLWEIAEEKIPYMDIPGDIAKIRELVIAGEREPFSSPNEVPIKWQQIWKDTMGHDPKSRPALASMFSDLFELSKTRVAANPPYQHINTYHHAPAWTVKEAIAEHKKKNSQLGDKMKAFETFKAYSDLGDIVAKYWVGYYLYNNQLNLSNERNLKGKRLAQAARLFREAADRGMVDAQLRYGNCLWKGDGVEKDPHLAIEYFKKAANRNNATAMYNLGKIFYCGNDIAENKESGKRYLKMAAAYGQSEAQEMCKRYNIS